MSKKADLIKNTAILGIGKLSTQLISFILLPLYTMVLAPAQFGTVDLITSYVTLLAPLIMIQIDRAAFRLLVEARGNDAGGKRVISNTLRIVLPIIVVASVTYFVVTIFLPLEYSALIATAIITTIISSLFLQFARGFGKNISYAVTSIFIGVTNLVASIIFVMVLKMGVEGVLLALVVSNVVAVVYLFFALRLYQYISFGRQYSDSTIRKELIEFSWPLVPSAVSWWFIRTFDRTLVTLFLGAAANGIYAAANKYALIFNALYSIFDLSWTESASAHINSKDRDKFFSDVYNASFRLFASLGLVMIAITPFAFNIIIGKQYEEAYTYIPLLIIGALFNAAISQYSVVYIAKKMTKAVLVTSIFAAALSVGLNIVLIPTLGVFGASLALAIAFFVMAVWRHFDIKKYVTVTFTGRLFVKLAVAYAVVASLYYVKSPVASVIGLIVAAAVTYGFSGKMLINAGKAAVAKVRKRKSAN